MGRENLWLPQVKDETRTKVAGSLLMQGCAQGDEDSLDILLHGFWPFVNAFPGIISSKYGRSGSRRAKLLAQMESDERGHRTLWLLTCQALKIEESELTDEPLPRMQRLIDVVGDEDADLSETFLRFLAVELTAEAMSAVLMEHDEFKDRLGQEGLRWFNVHLGHESSASVHERLTISLAEQHEQRGRNRGIEWFAQETARTVDHFIEAAEECRELRVGAR